MVEFIKDIFYIILVFLALIISAPITLIIMALFTLLLPFILLYDIIWGDENL